MNAKTFLNKYVSEANNVAASARVPALVLLAVGAFVSKWSSSFSLVEIAKQIRTFPTYDKAAKHVNDHETFFRVLLSADKDYYTINSYMRMLRLALGYSDEIVYTDIVVVNQSAFMAKLFAIAQKLNIHPEWLMIVMWNESKFKYNAVNPYTGAVGLIQFMPATARSLGTSTEALARMSNVQQLDYVYKYFAWKSGKMYSLYDLYKITFFPISLGKAGNWVFESKDLQASTVARQNKIFDINKDGKITVDEFEKYLYNTYVSNLV